MAIEREPNQAPVNVPRATRTCLLAIVTVLAAAAPWFNVPIDRADTAGMLSHLHTFFVGGDLLYDDEYDRLGMSPLFAFVTSNDLVSNHWPIGATWLQAPGYLLGIVASFVLAGLGVGAPNTLGLVVVLGVRAIAMLVLAAFVWTVHRMLAPSIGRGPATLCAGTCTVGTPLLYYASEAAMRPHLFGAAVTLAIVVIWFRRSERASEIACVAALAGLATCVRPQLAFVWLLAAELAWHTHQRARNLMIAFGCALPWALVNPRLQAFLYGADAMQYARPVHHHVVAFLGSPYHGVLVWSPVIMLGVGGLALATARRERGAWLLIAIVLGQIWMDSGQLSIEPFAVLGTRTWGGGTSFGPRKLVDILPLLLPGIPALVRAFGSRSRGLAWLAAVLSVPTMVLYLAAFVDPDRTTGGVHDWGSLWGTAAMAFDPAAWRRCLEARAMPLLVPLVVTAVVSLPLWSVGAWATRTLRQSHAVASAWLLITLAGAAFVHLWLFWLVYRTDATREREAERMLDARLRYTPSHVEAVAAVPDVEARIGAVAE